MSLLYYFSRILYPRLCGVCPYKRISRLRRIPVSRYGDEFLYFELLLYERQKPYRRRRILLRRFSGIILTGVGREGKDGGGNNTRVRRGFFLSLSLLFYYFIRRMGFENLRAILFRTRCRRYYIFCIGGYSVVIVVY